MQKVLFITHEYFPVGSAITNCLKPIIDEMLKNNIEVNVLTRKYPLDLKEEEIIEGVKVHRVKDTYLELLNKRDKYRKNSLMHFIYRVYFHFIYKQKQKSTEEGYYSKKLMIKRGKELCENIDTIISCSYPFTSHKIAYEIKDKQKWVIYQFDPYTYNYTLPKNRKDERLKIELEYLNKADAIFITEESYKENIKTELKALKNKYKVLPYGLIKKPDIDITSEKTKNITLTFAGTLYKDLREPFLMLDILLKLDLPLEIHIYYFAENDIIEGLKKYNNKVYLHYRKTKQECDEALAKTNIVLNIGNAMLNQTPSKVFELISLGKPILNFYSHKNDTSKNMLKNYELVYNVNTSNYKTKEISEFITKNKYKVKPFDKATKNYLKAEEVAAKFIKEVDQIENR